MKNIFFLSAFSMVVLLVSCKKKSTVTIQAQDYITGEGADYAGMEYRVVEKWTPSFEPKTKVAASGFLDDNGYANFDLRMNPNRSYILSVTEPANICYGGLQLKYLNHEKNNEMTFGFAHCSNVKINFNNVNCFDNTDLFKFYYEGREVPGKEGLNGSLAKEAVGCYSYDNPDFSETPVGRYFYKWEITRNGTLTTVYDTISLVKDQYFIYNVDY